MGRIRTVKPEFFTHVDLSSLPAEAHLLAAGLLCYADDEGYFDAHPKLIQAAVFPLRELQTPIVELIDALKVCGYITVTEVKGKRVGHVVTFTTHQRVNRPTPSRLKPHECLTEPSLPEGKGKEQGKEVGMEHEGVVRIAASNETVTPQMVSRAVCESLAISGRELLRILDDVCMAQMKAGRDPTELRDFMVAAWENYIANRANLTYAWGAEKFFGETYWKDDNLWPWKENYERAKLPDANGGYEDILQRAKDEDARQMAESQARRSRQKPVVG